jgi:hypothetical protein
MFHFSSTIILKLNFKFKFKLNLNLKQHERRRGGGHWQMAALTSSESFLARELGGFSFDLLHR